jgi:predicted secreted protein
MNSTNGVILIEGTVVAELTGASLSITHSPRNVTNKGSAGWRELLEGLREWNGSVNAMYIPNGAWVTLFAAYNSRTQVTLRFASTEVGDDYYEGEAYFGSGTLDSPAQEDNVVFDVSFEGTGVLTEGATT